MLRDLETPATCSHKVLPMCGVWEFVASKLVECAVEATMCYDLRRLLLESAGCSISRVSHKRLACRLTLTVEPIERGVWHNNLATNLEERWVVIAVKFEGYRADGAHIIGYIVATATVATCYRTAECAILVC